MGSYKIVMEAGRPQDYFLDIADDGYVITTDSDLSEEKKQELRDEVLRGGWPESSAITKLDECGDPTCSCSRMKNPHARDLFIKSALTRLSEVCVGKKEVSYASLGCGLLKFDFTFLELLLSAGIPVTSVHLVDSKYEKDAEKAEPYRAALVQFAAWFATCNIDVYAHGSLEKFAFRVRQANSLPVAVVQIDVAELTGVFESEVKPMLEEVLQYGGLFCALTSRGAASGEGSAANSDAWGEVWRLVPETGRMRQVVRTRYNPALDKGIELADDEPLPPAVNH